MKRMPYPGTPIPTWQPPWRRWLDALGQALRPRRRGDAVAGLQGLSDHSLRDIGLDGGARPQRRSLAAADFLRGL